MSELVAYIEARLTKLRQLQLFNLDEDRDLTSFEDGLITTSVAHAFLE